MNMWNPRPKYIGINFDADIFTMAIELIFVNPSQLYHQYSTVFLIGYFHHLIFRDEILFFSYLKLIRYGGENYSCRIVKD